MLYNLLFVCNNKRSAYYYNSQLPNNGFHMCLYYLLLHGCLLFRLSMSFEICIKLKATYFILHPFKFNNCRLRTNYNEIIINNYLSYIRP